MMVIQMDSSLQSASPEGNPILKHHCRWQLGTQHQGIESALVNEDHLHILHLTLANTKAVLGRSSNTAFCGVTRLNILSYSIIRLANIQKAKK